MTCIAAVSYTHLQWLEVRVHKNGQIYEMKFSRGAITQEMKVIGQIPYIDVYKRQVKKKSWCTSERETRFIFMTAGWRNSRFGSKLGQGGLGCISI